MQFRQVEPKPVLYVNDVNVQILLFCQESKTSVPKVRATQMPQD